jgi:very-short-patch-repair endonuclease
LLWYNLRNKQIQGVRFHRQYGIGRYVVDFYCPKYKLAIELDGGQHDTVRQIEYDKMRTQKLDAYGVRVLRFWDNDIFENMDGVLERIISFINPTQPPL